MTAIAGKVTIRTQTRGIEPEIGVTTEMVLEVLQLIYEMHRDEHSSDWAEFLRDAQRDPSLRDQYFGWPDGTTFGQFGENAAKVRAVISVADVILAPPRISEDPEA